MILKKYDSYQKIKTIRRNVRTFSRTIGKSVFTETTTASDCGAFRSRNTHREKQSIYSKDSPLSQSTLPTNIHFNREFLQNKIRD